MWKTAAYADGKPIHGLWKRTGLSHRTANSFPTPTPNMAVYTHSHNAYYSYYLSYPFLSFTERKRGIKRRDIVLKLTEDYIPICHDFIVFLCYNNCQVVGLGLQSRGSRVIQS